MAKFHSNFLITASNAWTILFFSVAANLAFGSIISCHTKDLQEVFAQTELLICQRDQVFIWFLRLSFLSLKSRSLYQKQTKTKGENEQQFLYVFLCLIDK
jgi:hypothetical protein